MNELLYTLLLGLVEGITEFLPVSSTGHLFLMTNWLGPLRSEDFTETFNIFIQIGAIAAVVVYFRHRILDLLLGGNRSRPTAAEQRPSDAPAEWQPTPEEATSTLAQRKHAIAMIILATVPVLIVGYLTHKWVKSHLEGSRIAIATALTVGGVLMLIIERMPRKPRVHAMEAISSQQALGIGLAQILAAVFPGTSRSAATIMGGLLGGLSRPVAAEFSFFLAIPAMFAACGYSLLKYLKAHPHVASQELMLLGLGTLVAFIVAWIVIAAFMNYIRRHNFIPFAVYRIALGVAVFAWALAQHGAAHAR